MLPRFRVVAVTAGAENCAQFCAARVPGRVDATPGGAEGLKQHSSKCFCSELSLLASVLKHTPPRPPRHSLRVSGHHRVDLSSYRAAHVSMRVHLCHLLSHECLDQLKGNQRVGPPGRSPTGKMQV